MGRFVPGNPPGIDRLIEDAISSIASELSSLRIPRLAGVVLGGGFGRGEGGVFESGALSNDLDFYVVTEKGVGEAEIDAIGAALKPVSEKWSAELGVDVDFCRAKTPWRLKHDEERLMVQELVHGYVDVFGRPGEELFAHVRRLEPSQLPWSEAVRLLMNRGAGLLLAAEKTAELERSNRSGSADTQALETFINRNINKCVLGAGDARLIAEGRYEWKIGERTAALGDAMYSRAVEWKLHPTGGCVCTWETARDAWLDAFDRIAKARPVSGPEYAKIRPSLRHALRWVVRRRTLGDWRTLGRMPECRVVQAMRGVIAQRAPFPAALRKDWMIFN